MIQDGYRFKFDRYGNTANIQMFRLGDEISRNNYCNKGTAFTEEERRLLLISGSLPPAVRTLRQQVLNSTLKVDFKDNDIERFIYMRALFDRNVTLAHAVIKNDVKRFLPIIYTPTVGYAVQQYSSMFREANGLHFYPGNIDLAEDILSRYIHRNIRVAVVTDNQGILGIGDQGVGGIAICLGKLMLYTQGAGIAPWHCLPISLDVGTNNKKLLADEDYLGWRHPRLTGEAYLDFIKRFARAFRNVFPNALCQWEDFSKQNAFAIRDTYLHDMISFNDDIQGTGAVALAAILSAMKIKKENLTDQIFLVHGAGAGGVGIAEQLDAALLAAGLSKEEAGDRIFTLDSHGLVTTARALEPYKQRFAKNPNKLDWLSGPHDGSLLSVIKNAKVTVLIGTSGQANSFTREVIEAMAQNTDRPVILPLSNPTNIAEAVPENIYQWTNGRALVATGSPFGPVNLNSKPLRIGQCNNVFIFPGVGLGVLASGAKEVIPAFFTTAAKTVSESVSVSDLKNGVLVPPVENLEEISTRVAMAVGNTAFRENLGGPCAFSEFQHNNDPDRLAELIANMQWHPEYLPTLPGY